MPLPSIEVVSLHGTEIGSYCLEVVPAHYHVKNTPFYKGDYKNG